ncbi:major capsid protein [Sutterella sp.]|uniref:major capsid protein n=1 Tax=Sutterella sp. TaxID=1981025 RepID=UPI0026DF52F8|nr:hypothetical protein [Sutterella sp.]MDO5531061.1 hypothetical protein [Sutterella sp.]
MATNPTSTTHPTLLDVVSRLDGDGKIAPIAEVLNEDLPILRDIGFIQCNSDQRHVHTIRTGLPTPTWRKLYGGVLPSKSQTAQVTDVCGNLEAYSEVDKDLADLNGNTSAWRFSEERPFIEAMGQTMAETIFYGDVTVNPERFTGIAPRYNTLNTDTPCARMVKSMGGTSDLTSLYFISHSVFHGLYPKGSTGGLSKTDKGQVTITKDDGSMFEAYRTHFKWGIGTTLDDWRGCARVCNVDINNVDGDALIAAMIKAKNEILAKYVGRTKLYVRREIMTILELAALSKSYQCLKITEAADQFKTSFFGIPIVVCDSISINEDQVTAD